ncbi:unnamed protein product [Cyprideis torosa]|uniref:RecQ-like DNA helicase BLM n=1 Tax=Cyprideis torosa TaxID=163714 RepID=A0A7R8WJD9_9CRUS|nr:unnamed protein product [Cyprideis torosa]CAG0900025.1 unnamed protein product [Cyprideis torosa]
MGHESEDEDDFLICLDSRPPDNDRSSSPTSFSSRDSGIVRTSVDVDHDDDIFIIPESPDAKPKFSFSKRTPSVVECSPTPSKRPLAPSNVPPDPLPKTDGSSQRKKKFVFKRRTSSSVDSSPVVSPSLQEQSPSSGTSAGNPSSEGNRSIFQNIYKASTNSVIPTISPSNSTDLPPSSASGRPPSSLKNTPFSTSLKPSSTSSPLNSNAKDLQSSITPGIPSSSAQHPSFTSSPLRSTLSSSTSLNPSSTSSPLNSNAKDLQSFVAPGVPPSVTQSPSFTSSPLRSTPSSSTSSKQSSSSMFPLKTSKIQPVAPLRAPSTPLRKSPSAVIQKYRTLSNSIVEPALEFLRKLQGSAMGRAVLEEYGAGISGLDVLAMERTERERRSLELGLDSSATENTTDYDNPSPSSQLTTSQTNISWPEDIDDDIEEENLLMESSWQMEEVQQTTVKKSPGHHFPTTSSASDFPEDNQALVPSVPQQQRQNSFEVMGRFYGTHKNDGASGEFSRTDFPFSNRVDELFRNIFGLRKFRVNQLEAINAALSGHDTFILMPTGGGKSLCYQLPGIVSPGVTVVVSPLRSLIQDQVQKLTQLDIPGTHLSGEMNTMEVSAIYQDLQTRSPVNKLLYVTPEKIGGSPRLMACLDGLYARNLLSRIVVDEGHCVSQWGHDFRPDYKKLGQLREKFPEVPLMVLTATATPRVRTDVLTQLKMKPSTKIFMSSFNRSNLEFSVEPKETGFLDKLAARINREFKGASGIVYCLSRNDCEKVAEKLKASGIPSAAYHAGLSDPARSEVQNKWIGDRFKVVVATIAFGMGIDKPDVRFVFHHSIPKSIEGYYQEAGRAGRDGEKAICVLFYSYQDVKRHKNMIEKSEGSTMASKKQNYANLNKVIHYCENKTDCRRVLQLEYFGELKGSSSCDPKKELPCDNCRNKGSYSFVDVTALAQKILRSVKHVCENSGRRRFTVLDFVHIFRGSEAKKVRENQHEKLEMHGIGKSWNRNDAERLFHELVLKEFLREDLVFGHEELPIAYVGIGRECNRLLSGGAGQLTFALRTGNQAAKEAAPAVPVTAENSRIVQLRKECVEALKTRISEIADQRQIKASIILPHEAVKLLSETMPETKEELLQVEHLTQAVVDKYGQEILEVTARFAAERLVILAEEAEDEAMEEEEFEPTPPTNTRGFGRGRGGRRFFRRGGGGKRKRSTSTKKTDGAKMVKKFNIIKRGSGSSGSSSTSSGVKSTGPMKMVATGGGPGLVSLPHAKRAFLGGTSAYHFK